MTFYKDLSFEEDLNAVLFILKCLIRVSLSSTEDPGPSTQPSGLFRRKLRRWYPIGEPGAPCVARAMPQPWYQALRTGQDSPHFSFWNVDSGPRIPSALQSPTTLSALQSDVSGRASGSDYPPGEGAVVGPACSGSSGSGRLVLVFRRGPAAPGSHFLWRLSHSPRDPQTPQAVGTVLAGERWTAPAPQLEPYPLKPSGDPVCRMLDLCGVRVKEARGQTYQQLRDPLTVSETLSNCIPLSEPQFPYL